MKYFYLTDSGKVRDHNEDSVVITKNDEGEYIFTDGHTWDEASTSENQLVTIYKDGKIVEPVELTKLILNR